MYVPVVGQELFEQQGRLGPVDDVAAGLFLADAGEQLDLVRRCLLCR